MSDSCCAIPEANTSGKDICPACGERGKSVASHTVNSLVIPERSLAEGYPDGYFCQNPTCATLYFFDNGMGAISKDEVNVRVGFKEAAAPQLVCYCYEHTREAIQADFSEHGESTIELQIRQEVESGSCSCEMKNPTGRCCLGDVRAAYKDLKVMV